MLSKVKRTENPSRSFWPDQAAKAAKVSPDLNPCRSQRHRSSSSESESSHEECSDSASSNKRGKKKESKMLAS